MYRSTPFSCSLENTAVLQPHAVSYDSCRRTGVPVSMALEWLSQSAVRATQTPRPCELNGECRANFVSTSYVNEVAPGHRPARAASPCRVARQSGFAVSCRALLVEVRTSPFYVGRVQPNLWTRVPALGRIPQTSVV